ncbi:hypothetical protein FHS95_002375 [Sphingomonas naasensis]|uniref:DUF3558 domain-containing protein n=1 Tax=Sphingomonas naasensis TaxID=1344951 RepID=A0A4S1W5L9_9SPHN|nr:hypothetical protein [Sphingomonas naasensis]NIJ20683.1 hypothetical protein [Sphingomonas naasensis]TGX37593.1 hypothetical protein E5A74_19800 [Sphingomonas naasensis]
MSGPRKRAGAGAMAAGLLLVGCGGSNGTPPQSDAGETARAPVAGRWDARDACPSLGRDRAAALGGAAVTDARLETISAGGGGLAAACTFTYANGATLMVLTREAPDADATSTAIEHARTGGGLAPPADPVPGLGKAAFWSDAGKQAQLFIDDRRYVTINFFKLPAGDDARARSLAIAKALL